MNNTDSLLEILEIAPFGCLMLSKGGQVGYANLEALEILCYQSFAALSGKDFLEILVSEERGDFTAFLEQLDDPDEKPGWVNFNLVTADGETIQVIFHGKRQAKEEGLERGNVLYLISPLSQNLVALIHDEMDEDAGDAGLYNKYETIFESVAVGIGIIDEEGYFDEANQTFADYFNLEKESVLGVHYAQVFGEPALGKIEELMETIQHEDAAHIKNVVTIENEAGKHRILEFSMARVFNDYECKNMTMMIVEDITYQRDTHKALIQSEKLALTGRLAASLAHEINNPLQTSIGCLGLAEEMLVENDDRDIKGYINMAIEELRRSARIVKKLRDLNRKTEQVEKFPVNLKKVMEGVLVLTKNKLYDRNITPVFSCQGAGPVVFASRDQMQQVLLNLVMNAIDALPNGGKIFLDLVQDEEHHGVLIKIRDTGVGISPENLDHLFDPFFTTKVDGLGLGLYICKSIIDDHGGELRVKSELGDGTEFSIWLPDLQADRGKE